MFEYVIYNLETGERNIAWGHHPKEMFEHYPQFNPNEWMILKETYVGE